MRDPHDERILILDFGSPSTQLLARQVRALNVYCEIHPCTVSEEKIRSFAPKGIILSPGPVSTADEAELPPGPRGIFEMGLPILGVGYGMRWMNSIVGDEPKPPFYGVPSDLEAKTLSNFVHEIAGCSGTWSMAAFAENAIAQIRRQVGDGIVICGLSGGVDSAVAALLIHQAIGDQLRCIFVDHGLLRKDEKEQVREVFQDRYHVPLRVVDAEERFLGKLAGVTDPEAKRKIIGHEFIAVFDEAAAEIADARFLAQGTLYSDVVESLSIKGNSVAVKSHHNVGGLPDTMKLALVEPLRELFKDEVRELGRHLGLPEHIVNRQPFPGPGLGIRCLGNLSRTRLDVLREADWIVREEIEKAGLTKSIWQAFAVLLPVQSVGVKDGKRTYEETCVIRAVDSVDAMTAGWSRIPYEILDRMSARLCHEVPGINRVVYDISSKPPATIEWE